MSLWLFRSYAHELSIEEFLFLVGTLSHMPVPVIFLDLSNTTTISPAHDVRAKPPVASLLQPI